VHLHIDGQGIRRPTSYRGTTGLDRVADSPVHNPQQIRQWPRCIRTLTCVALRRTYVRFQTTCGLEIAARGGTWLLVAHTSPNLQMTSGASAGSKGQCKWTGTRRNALRKPNQTNRPIPLRCSLPFPPTLMTLWVQCPRRSGAQRPTRHTRLGLKLGDPSLFYVVHTMQISVLTVAACKTRENSGSR
jgi:hypothetical protein